MATHPASSGTAADAAGETRTPVAPAAGPSGTAGRVAGSGQVDATGSASTAAEPTEPTKKPLTPEAQRALAEAEERRRLRDQQRSADGTAPKELGGRKGPDPARYGDWENGGIASDF